MSIAAIELPTDRRGAPPWRPGLVALRDAWFPIAHLPQVSEVPIRRLIHSQPYYLWREDGRVRVAEFHRDLLAERRDQASAFTGGAGDYPSACVYGMVWAWYGDPARADPALIPDIPFLPRDRVAADHLRGSYYYGATHELVAENVLDFTHINFIHREAAGFDEAESDEVEALSTSETITMVRRMQRLRPPEFQRNLAGVESEFTDGTQVVHIFLRSGVCLTNSSFEPGATSMPLLMGIVPESRTRTLMNWVYGPSDDTPEKFSREWPRHAPTVMEQDDSVLVPQNARYFTATAHFDRHTRFDAAGVRFRHLMNGLVARQRQGDFAYADDAFLGPELFETLKLRGTYSSLGGRRAEL
jgi:phenylpropionate dioxygenase-like ring-hydroxylating dioxygenase large terminal subunit